MQRNLYDPGNRRKNPLKRVLASSKREVVLDAPRKKHRSRSSSRSSSSSLDQVLILTSSRPNSREGVENRSKSINPIASVSTSRFYEMPKTLLEKQYEQNLSKFLPTCPDTDFQPLELERCAEEATAKHDESDFSKEGSRDKELTHPPGPVKLDSVDAPIEEPELTDKLLAQYCTDKAENSDFLIAMLVRASDFFMQKAHSSVLDANDIQGTKTYYSYVKTALKALLMVVKNYSTKLNLELELVICYNIAKIFFYETDNLDLSDAFINKAISLSNRNGLTKIALTSELFYCQILEVSDPNLLEAFLTEKQSTYLKKGMRSTADLFGLLRSTHLIVTSSTIGYASLQTLSIQPQVQPIIRILSALYQADLQLYRGSPLAAEDLLENLQITQIEGSDQFLAMYHLVRFAALIQSRQDKKARDYLQVVTRFIMEQRSNGWPHWNEDGSVNLHLLQGLESEPTIPFALQGLNSDEFVIMFYFLSGVLFLSEKSTFKKANKVFSSCLEIIEPQLQELTQARAGSRNFSIRLLTGKIIRLNYVRYSVYYYRVWLAFMDKNDFSGVKFVQQFINDFDEENFTKEELSYYKLLIPRFLLLTAMYFQAQGDLTASKYYFMRVRDLCCSKNANQVSHKISYLQRGLGIGCESIAAVDEYSELYMFATLHLLQIIEYQIKIYSSLEELEAKSKLSASRNFLADLYLDLSKAVDPKNTKSSSFKNFTSSNILFELSFKVLSCIYLNRGFTNKINNHDTALVAEFSAYLKNCPPNDSITILVAYVLYCLSLNLDQRNELLSKCLRTLADRDDNIKMLKLFFLREAKLKKSAADYLEEAKPLLLQIETLQESLQAKLRNAKFSASISN